jgi:hypothetical protein
MMSQYERLVEMPFPSGVGHVICGAIVTGGGGGGGAGRRAGGFFVVCADDRTAEARRPTQMIAVSLMQVSIVPFCVLRASCFVLRSTMAF